MPIALAIAAAYVVGSIDFAVIVARMHGVDIREVGSGNPGASNVLRTLGRFPAAMVFLGDMMKGVVGAAMGMVASGVADPQVQWAFAAGLAAVAGHCYPVFHKFKGGKGVATSAGVLLFTLPLVAVINAVLWVVLVRLTKTASIASLAVVAITIPLALWRGVSGEALLWLGGMILLIVWRHRGNIQRMVRGDEQKVPT
jgi:glycerol-3-phosphate acyltransferase PlsY